MRFLHTSDWHLGRSLYGRNRYKEFTLFLDWLYETIIKENIDVLIVAGDIFDTTTPSNKAQELYYQFLCRTAGTCCQHIIITAGNHDSPSFIDAPKDILRSLNVHVIGSVTDNPEDEVITLKNDQNIPQAIVCAIPYLKDRDIRKVTPGETVDEKNQKIIEGTKKHYESVCSIAQNIQKKLKNQGHNNIPIVATGHLFTAGGKTLDGDGVRELYVGTLSHINATAFPKAIDYLALGHLHVPQKVGGKENIRYSGSPLAMGFGEAGQQKKVILVDFKTNISDIKEIDIPCFQQLEKISGTLQKITERINQLQSEKNTTWLEIEYTGNEPVTNLGTLFENISQDSNLEIRRIKNRTVFDKVIKQIKPDENLDDLDPTDIFKRCMDTYEVAEENRAELLNSYQEILNLIHEEDINKE